MLYIHTVCYPTVVWSDQAVLLWHSVTISEALQYNDNITLRVCVNTHHVW